MWDRDDGQRQLLDVESMAGHMRPAGSVFKFLADHRHELFPDDAFEDLFPPGRGRPSTPEDVIASVMVLQTLHSLSDRETAEAVTEVIEQSGALSGRKRRALDSTILEDAVARQDTVTQLVAQIHRVGREIPGADVLVAALTGHDYAKPGKPDIAWDDRAARDDLVSTRVTDALALLADIDITVLTDTQQETVLTSPANACPRNTCSTTTYLLPSGVRR